MLRVAHAPIVGAAPDTGETTKLGPNAWHADHVVLGAMPAFNCGDSGAAPGIDSTAAIQAAIDAATAAGGGRVVFPQPGEYRATQLVCKDNVLIDGGHRAAVILKQIGGTDADFLVSEHFDALTGTGASRPTTPTVPIWLGLANITIDGNKAANSAGRGIAWYAMSMVMLGVVVVQNCADDNIYTECGTSGDTPIDDQQQGLFETVISISSGGHGWHFRGPADSRIGMYLCILGDDWGFENESSGAFFGGIDSCAFMHVWTFDGNTNRNGIKLGTNFYGDVVYNDACQLLISGACGIGQVVSHYVGHQTGFHGVRVTSNGVQIGRLYADLSPDADTTNATLLKWEGSYGQVGAAQCYGGAGTSTGYTALHDTGSANRFDNLLVLTFPQTGATAIKAAPGGYASYAGFVIDCKTGFHYTATDGGDRAALTIYTNTGQTAVAGATPGAGARFDIREAGLANKGTDVRVVSSNAIAMDSTALQTITLAHTCLYTPTARNVLLTFTTPTVTDFAWAIPPYFVSADGTNLTIKCQLATASATGGAKGDVIAHVRMGA